MVNETTWQNVKIVFVIVIVMSKDILTILAFVHVRNVIVILRELQ